MSHSTLALLTVPIVTGVIGYVTNWTGVLMLFYPVRFRGWRVPGAQTVVRLLPHKIQQIPGVMLGGIGWQGIVPSRAAKMGSLAVDSGIAKIGRPREFFNQLEPEKIAEQIIVSARQDLPGIVDGIMEREQPRLWQRAARGDQGDDRGGACWRNCPRWCTSSPARSASTSSSSSTSS